MCSKSLKNRTNNSTKIVAVDNLFTLIKTWMAFKKFYRTPVTDESETLLSFSAAFCAVETDAVDSFRFLLRKLRESKHYIGENESEVGQDVQH